MKTRLVKSAGQTSKGINSHTLELNCYKFEFDSLVESEVIAKVARQGHVVST